METQLSPVVFILSGLAYEKNDRIWSGRATLIEATKLSDYSNHNIETAMILEALRQSEARHPYRHTLILSDRYIATSRNFISKLQRCLSDDFTDIHYLTNHPSDKNQNLMCISPRGRKKILGLLPLPDGRIFSAGKNLTRQLNSEAEIDNFSVSKTSADYFELAGPNARINRAYEKLACNDPIIMLPQIIPPPQFRISGLIWFIFIVIVLLLLAWALIKIGPGGAKTTKSDKELSKEKNIILRGETQFFDTIPNFDDYLPI